MITLVAVLVGVLGKKKKPSPTGSGEEGGSRVGGFMENLEKAFQMGQEEQVVADYDESEESEPFEESDYEPVVAQQATSEPSSLMREWESYNEKSGSMLNDSILSDADIVTDPLEVIQLGDDEGTDYFEVVKDFNAATAVVYAAIINRIDY